MLSSSKLFRLHQWSIAFVIIFTGLMGISGILQNKLAFIISILFACYSAFLLRYTLQEVKERLI